VSYYEILRLIHIAGAIIGLGPTFAFAILGPAAGKAGPNGGVAIMETMEAIEKRLVYPVALLTQPVTGTLMIFELGYDSDFFGREWLVTSIVIYAAILYIALFLNSPTLHRMIHLAKTGEAQTPEFEKLSETAARAGMAMTIMIVVIIYLMIIKPGA
jgi:uncharacterized membrane protein